jgi:Calcineurin-like phosphoesterase
LPSDRRPLAEPAATRRVRHVLPSGIRRSFEILVAVAVATVLQLMTGAGPATAATPPRVNVPSVAFAVGGTVTAKSVPVIISWDKTANSGAIDRYTVRMTRSGGAWAAVPLASLRSHRVRIDLVPGDPYRFLVRAAGPGGSTSQVSLPVVASLEAENADSIRYRGQWTTAVYPDYLGGAARTTVDAGASATWTGKALGVALIATRGPNRGGAELALDGSPDGSVVLTARTRSFRRVVAARSFATEDSHAFALTAAGGVTPRVDLDGIAILRSVAPAPLVAVGDVAACGSPGDELSAKLAARLPGPIALLGDLAYPNGSAADFTDCFAPSWGGLVPRAKPVPGNHEYATPNASAYFDYFGALAHDPAQGWYAYSVGTWRVYALNSNCTAVGGCGKPSAQYRWLKASLAAHPRACSLAYWHLPRFSSGAHGSYRRMLPLWQLLVDHGADVILAGHDHDYERLAPADALGRKSATGVRAFVVGTGGVTLRPLTRPPLSITRFRQADSWGLLALNLGAGGYDWQFIDAGTGATLDAGVATCH